MVRVTGTKGNVVDIQVLGINAVMLRLRQQGKMIESSADLGVVKAGAYVEEEVKESIMGNRPEPKSVDTGRLGNSIEFTKTGKAQGKVEPKGDTYPGTSTTTKDVALWMEYSPNILGGPRRHFRNTEARTKGEVKGIIQTEIKIGKI